MKKIKDQLTAIIDTVKGAKEYIALYSELTIAPLVDNDGLKNVPIIEHAIKVLNFHDVYKQIKLKEITWLLLIQYRA